MTILQSSSFLFRSLQNHLKSLIENNQVCTAKSALGRSCKQFSNLPRVTCNHSQKIPRRRLPLNGFHLVSHPTRNEKTQRKVCMLERKLLIRVNIPTSPISDRSRHVNHLMWEHWYQACSHCIDNYYQFGRASCTGKEKQPKKESIRDGKPYLLL